MKFEDALLALAAGREVARQKWFQSWLTYKHNMSPHSPGLLLRFPDAVPWTPDIEDMRAEDWVIVRDPALSGEHIAMIDAEKTQGLTGEVHFEPKRLVARGLEPCADTAARRASDALKAAERETDPLAEIHHAFEDLRDKLEPLTGGPGYYAPALEQCWLRLREAEFWARHLVQDSNQRHEAERFTTRAARQ